MSTCSLTSFSLLSIIFLRISNCQWYQSTTLLPFYQNCMAIGSYNDSIYILGGSNSLNTDLLHSLVVYNTMDDVFVSHDNYILTDIFGYSSYYTQIHNILYIIVEEGTKILSYDMQTETINYNYTTIESHVATNYEISSCLTSYTSNAKNHLFVAGGADELWKTIYDTVQVYDISSGIWLTDVPPMQLPRFSHTCVVDSITNILYAIGGKGSSRHTTIEYIHTNDINQQNWTFLDDTLSVALRDIQSVYFDEIIYVIGGTERDNDPRFDIVHMIDTVSGAVTVSDDKLRYAIASTATIRINHRLYVFGGFDGDNTVNTWMYYDLDMMMFTPTTQPTNAPSTTATTSIAPGNMPSAAPHVFLTTETGSNMSSATTFLSTTQQDIVLPTRATSLLRTALSLWMDTSNDIDSISVKNHMDEDTQLILIIIIGIIVFCIIVLCLFYCSYKDVLTLDHVNKIRNHTAKGNDVKMVEKDINTRQFNITPINISTPQQSTISTSGMNMMDKKLNRHALEVHHWLNNVVGLPVYYDVFIQNGYESLQIIREISSIDELQEIGIEVTNHQQKIFEEIQELKYDYDGVEEQPVDMMRTVEGN